jgi:hypothetical protein
MQFDSSGLPTGTALAGETRLRSTVSLFGDVVTLGDGARLANLVIEDIADRAGNVVAISTRYVGDVVFASIAQCELINPNAAGIQPPGPTGHGVLLISRNLGFNFDPPPHDDSAISLNMAGSIVRSPGGGSGVMAINFASRSRIAVELRGNVIGGGVVAAGGVSRPDDTYDSSVRIESHKNLYRSDSPLPTEVGWQLDGGADAPIPGLVAGTTIANEIYFRSTLDRIEGFAGGILARGGRRISALAGQISLNQVEINATQLEMVTTTRDLELYGDFSFAPGVTAGADNLLRLGLRRANGSGVSDNQYGDSNVVPAGGNQFEVPGSSVAFGHNNSGIDPLPAAEFFTSRH